MKSSQLQKRDSAGTVNNATSMSVALKNIAYRDIYRELEQARCFNFKMLDGALVTLRYHHRQRAENTSRRSWCFQLIHLACRFIHGCELLPV
jgi:hypothetical protein